MSLIPNILSGFRENKGLFSTIVLAFEDFLNYTALQNGVWTVHLKY